MSVLDIGLFEPAGQAALRYPEILRDLPQCRLALASHGDHVTTEFFGVGLGHGDASSHRGDRTVSSDRESTEARAVPFILLTMRPRRLAARLEWPGVAGFVFRSAAKSREPMVTALCLGSGASGGLFTPMMSTGALFGAGTGILWTQMWPGSPVGEYAMVGAAATIGSSIQAPLTGLVLVLELTHSGFTILTSMIAATVVATVVVRYLDGYSIYSARLPSRTPTTGTEHPGLAS